jgi:hypothetical protein
VLRAAQGPRRPGPWAPVMCVLLGLQVPGLVLLPAAVAWGLIRLQRSREWLRPSSDWLLRALGPMTVAALVMGATLNLAVSDQLATRAGPYQLLAISGWLVSFYALAAAGGLGVARVGIGKALLLASAGLLFGAIAFTGIDGPNPWKFALALPVGTLLLYVAARSSLSRVLIPAAALTLAGYSFAQSSRSAGGAAVLALLLWAAPARLRKRPTGKQSVVVAALVGLAYLITSQAMGSGLLGETVRASYDQQTEGGRSLLLTGRVEINAALTLAGAAPWGFGVATTPVPTLQGDAVSAVRAAGGDTYSGYYQRSVFTDRVDLHSGVANLWYHFGVAGLAFAGVVLGILASGLAQLRRAVGRDQAVCGYYVLASAVWAFVFSPMQGLIFVGIGLAVSVAAIRLAERSTGQSGETRRSTHWRLASSARMAGQHA